MSTEGLSSLSSSAIIWTAVPTVACTLMAWAWLNQRKNQTAKTKKFHVDYPHPDLPLALRMIAKLPEVIRRPMLIQGSLPTPPLDGVDLSIENSTSGRTYDPYEYKELVPNQLWRVRYRFVTDPKRDETLSMFGVELSDRSLLDSIDDPTLRENLKKDMDDASALAEKNKCSKDPKEHGRNCLHNGIEDSQDMLVARLKNGEENGLLIYNPCRMHPPVVEFLKSRGAVRYIVSGSSSHTNQLPQASSTFPTAKVVCAKSAELKCRAAGLTDAEYCIYTDHSDETLHSNGYHSTVAELRKYGIQIFHVVGDALTQSLVVVAHGHLFDTDLTTYGNGARPMNIDQSDWETGSKVSSGAHMFYWAALDKAVVKGYLPDFRLMAMDPSSPFTRVMLDSPSNSSCKQMAESLREMLKLEFDWVDNVHSRRQASVPAAEFKECICNSWNWLDGNNLA